MFTLFALQEFLVRQVSAEPQKKKGAHFEISLQKQKADNRLMLQPGPLRVWENSLLNAALNEQMQVPEKDPWTAFSSGVSSIGGWSSHT